jgi:hypothetical protein
MDHWSGDRRQGRVSAGARVAALGSSRHRFRREDCFVLGVRPMRLRRAPGTRERRRVAQPVVHPQPSSIRRCGVVAEAVFEADIPLPNVANL